MGNEHWVEVALENLCTICTGKRDVNEGNSEGKFIFFTCAQDPTKIDFSEFSGEAILIAGNGFFNVKYFDGEFNAYQRTYVLQNFKILSRYLYLYIKFSLDTLTQDSRGTTVKYIRLSNLQNHLIPLPPLNEQKRIVEKLDAVLPKVRQSKERLEKIAIILKKFRQTVLAAACSGRLTEKWREGKETINNFNKEPLSDFPYEIPKNWIWTELDNISDGFQYGTSSKSESNGKLPVLRMGNLQNGRIDWSDLKYSNDKNDISKYKLHEGDVLFNRTNSPDLVGKTSIFKGDQGAIFAGYLIRIKHKKQYLNSDYLNYSLNTVRAREWCKEVKSDGVSQSNINAQILASFLVPLPPLPEQQEIVRRVETLFSLADSLEEKYQSAISRVNKIEQAVLAKAFRGELAEADPDDEPAGELLERILREKGNH
jgi:type I restriction enzyme S subunit